MTTIAALGGTGEQGRGLATRWAAAGVSVIIGSRDPQRAQAAASEIGGPVTGLGNLEAAAAADVVLVAVPYAAHAATVADIAEAVAGKILIDCVNPLGFDKQGAHGLLVPEGSAAQQAQSLAPQARVVGAFHHVSAVNLLNPDLDTVDTDVLVLGDDREAVDEVIALADRIPGIRGLYGGRLRNAGQVEAFTANLISMNRRYKTHSGVRISGI